MAEQIISPGVFTNEDVPTILEAAAAPIGAAVVGPTPLGPVGIPTLVTTFSDFQTKFGTTFLSGGEDYSFLTSISAQNYFQQGGTNLLVTRVVRDWTSFTSSVSTRVGDSASHDGTYTGNGVFELSTISKGAVMNSTSSTDFYNGHATSTLVSGSKDNLRWEITSRDEASGTFTLIIRQGNDKSTDKKVIETYRGVSLDPYSDNYISKLIGDTYSEVAIDADSGDYFVKQNGEYPSKSNYVYVSAVNNTTPNYLNANGSVSDTNFTGSIPAVQNGAFASGGGLVVPSAGCNMNENITAGNTQGLQAGDYTNFIDLLKNKDEYKFNILSLPGLIHSLAGHKTRIDEAIADLQVRTDAIIPVDLVGYESAIDTATAEANTLNTSYAAAYYPWLLVNDNQTGKAIWCPPSTVIPSVYVFNDNTTAAWFAPAGLTRGTMPNVILPERTLPRADRDTLYENKINPIVKFPTTGVAVYGQKTLQSAASATDRVNVRRLLITLKNFIGNVAQGLVFEPNSLATRNAFLAVVVPYMELVQQRQGVYAFKVVMDDTNNGPDVIDRNELRGTIFLQPVKSAEFVVLDFNVLPTGAEFPS
jgi:phage tail sheath protein FI